MLNNIFPK